MQRGCGESDGRERVRRSGAGAEGARIHHLPGRGDVTAPGSEPGDTGQVLADRAATERAEAGERLSYMRDMIGQLEAMARQAGEPMLARMLALAHEEAYRSVAGRVQGDTRR